jgi:hypothetical protein
LSTPPPFHNPASDAVPLEVRTDDEAPPAAVIDAVARFLRRERDRRQREDKTDE